MYSIKVKQAFQEGSVAKVRDSFQSNWALLPTFSMKIAISIA